MQAHELKAARRILGLSAAKLAKALSDPDGDSSPVNWRTVYRWEAGNTIPGPVSVFIYQSLLKRGITRKAFKEFVARQDR